MNSLIIGAVGYLFEIQSHPQLSALAFARQVATYQCGLDQRLAPRRAPNKWVKVLPSS